MVNNIGIEVSEYNNKEEFYILVVFPENPHVQFISVF